MIDQEQISKLIQHRTNGSAYQRYLRRFTGFTSDGKVISNKESYILARDAGARTSGTTDLRRLVINRQIEISDVGKDIASSFELSFFTHGATKELYLAKAQEINARFDRSGATAAVTSRYRERINRALKADNKP